jgi:hypothetical protein
MSDIEKHSDHLKVILFDGTVMAEERFDRIASDYLKGQRAVPLLAKVKEYLILHQHMHRLTLRGRTYLACLRHHAVIHHQPVVVAYDMTKVLDKLASLSDSLDPPKKKELMW